MPHSTALQPGSVEAHINYIPRPADREKHVPVVNNYMTAGAMRVKRDRQPVIIHDMRESDEEFKLDVQGFQLAKFESKEKAFEDREQIKRVIEPETTEVLKKLIGCSFVHHVGHTIRRDPFQKADEVAKSDTPDDGIVKLQHPAMHAHVDQSYDGAMDLINAMADEPGSAHLLEKVAKYRWAIINVWKPIKKIQREPLAVCDARSVAEEDLILGINRIGNKLHPKGIDGDFRTWHIAYNPEHKWYWPSYMEPDEAILIKCFDSKKDGRARRSPHSAFNLPGEDGPPRESIEIRTVCFWEDDETE